MSFLRSVWWAANIAMLTLVGRLLVDLDAWIAVLGANAADLERTVGQAVLLGLAMPLTLVVLGSFRRRWIRLLLATAVAIGLALQQKHADAALLGTALIGLVLSRSESRCDPGLGAGIAALATLAGCGLASIDVTISASDIMGYCAVGAAIAFAVGRFGGVLMESECAELRDWRFDPVGLFVGMALCGTIYFAVPDEHRIPGILLAAVIGARACMRTVAPQPTEEQIDDPL